MIADPHQLQRFRHTPGQDLLSRDFRDQAAAEEQLRWWHNRAMHGVFGVRYGLRVRLRTAAFEPTAEIEGGLAYDGFGRELISPGRKTLRLPAGEQAVEPQVLVLRHVQHDGSSSPRTPAPACDGAAPPETAELAWLPARRLRPTDGVPLARLLHRDLRFLLDPKFRRPRAQPLARPQLGHGGTVAGGTAWESWDLGASQRLLLGLQVSIDTRAAGFTRNPCYFAWLQGGLTASLGDVGVFQLPVYSHLAETAPTGFRFRLLTFAFGNSDLLVATRESILSRARRQLSVCWLGIQMRSDEVSLPEVIHGHS